MYPYSWTGVVTSLRMCAWRSVWSMSMVSGTSSSRWSRWRTTSETTTTLWNTSSIHGTRRLNRHLSNLAMSKVSHRPAGPTWSVRPSISAETDIYNTLVHSWLLFLAETCSQLSTGQCPLPKQVKLQPRRLYSRMLLDHLTLIEVSTKKILDLDPHSVTDHLEIWYIVLIPKYAIRKNCQKVYPVLFSNSAHKPGDYISSFVL